MLVSVLVDFGVVWFWFVLVICVAVWCLWWLMV